VSEHIGVRRKHHINVVIFTVQTNWFWRCRQVVCGWLAFLFRTVFWIGSDVITQQVIQGHRQILTGSDRTPTPYRVNSCRNCTFRQQVRIFAALDRKLIDIGIGIQHVLNMDLLLGISRFFRDKINRQIEETLFVTIRQHIFSCTNQIAWLQVTTTQTETTRVKVRPITG